MNFKLLFKISNGKFSGIPYSKFCEDYCLSEFGILIDSEYHLSRIYDPWYEICEELPKHTKNKTIRNIVQNLPFISTSDLQNHNEMIAALTLIMQITSSYTRSEETMIKTLPKQLAMPFWDLAQKLEVPSGFSALPLLYNWEKRGEYLFPKYCFTENEGEKYFFGISQTCDYLFSTVFKSIYDANIYRNRGEKHTEIY